MSKIIDDSPVQAFSIRLRLKFTKEKVFLEFQETIVNNTIHKKRKNGVTTQLFIG
jgi:hypothetical protein